MKTIIICILSLFCVLSHSQEMTMNRLFREMPDSLIPYLSQSNRLDLIDFIESGMESKVVNGFDETVRLDKLTSDYMRLELSQSSVIEMKLLPYTNVESEDSIRQVVCMLMSFGADTRESSLNFYTTDWKRLSSEDMMQPAVSEWSAIPVMSDSDDDRIMQPCFLYMHLNPDSDTLEIDFMISLLSEEDKAIVLSVKKLKSLKWNGKTFK